MTTKIMLRTDQPRKDGTFSVVIRITENRKSRYMSTGHHVTKSQFKAGLSNWIIKHPLAVRMNQEIEEKIQSLFKPKVGITLYQAIRNKIEYYKSRQQVSAYVKLNSHLTNFKDAGCADIPLIYLTKEYVNKFINHRLSKGGMVSGIKKDLSSLSTAVSEYPVTDHFKQAAKNLKPKPINREKLTKEEISKIEVLELTGKEQLARDIFLFAFYAHGMRIGSVLTLEKSMIKNGVIRYRMDKGEKIRDIHIHPKLKTLLDKYNHSPYLFPLITEKINTEWERRNLVGAATAVVNKYLKIVAYKAGIEKKLTTHISRHTFAYLSLERNVSYETIKDALGHSDYRTTQAYLKSLSDKQINDEINGLYE